MVVKVIGVGAMIRGEERVNVFLVTFWIISYVEPNGYPKCYGTELEKKYNRNLTNMTPVKYPFLEKG